MTVILAAALAALAPAATSAATTSAPAGRCPDLVTAEAFICRAIDAQQAQRPSEAALAFEQAAAQTDPKDGGQARLFASSMPIR